MIWINRPAADSEQFARKLALLGKASLISPVMRIEPAAVTLQKKPDAIILTSRNALHALPQGWHDLPVYCVGGGTADAVRGAGYTPISGKSGALDLVDLIQPEHKHLLYLSGDDISVDLPTILSARGFSVERQIAYHAVAENELDAKVIASFRSGSVSAVAFFSPRAADIACNLFAHAGLNEHARAATACCLSLKVAEAAAQLPWKHIRSCALPSNDAMLELLCAR